MHNSFRRSLLTRKTTILITAAVIGVATTGAAAAAGHAPWQSSAPAAAPATPPAGQQLLPAEDAVASGHPGQATGTDAGQGGGQVGGQGASGGTDSPATTLDQANTTVPAPSHAEPGGGLSTTNGDAPATTVTAGSPTPEPTTTTVHPKTEPTTIPPAPTTESVPTTAPTSTTGDHGAAIPALLSLSCGASGDAPGSAACSWSGDIVPGFAGFQLLRSQGSGFHTVFSSADPHTTNFVDTGLAPGQYSYVVAEFDAANKIIAYSHHASVTIHAPEPSPTTPTTPAPTTEPVPTTTPAPPTTTGDSGTATPAVLTLSCHASGDVVGTVGCSWSGDTVAGFAGFQVLRSQGNGFHVVFSSSDPHAASFVDTGLAAGPYSYVVVEFDTANTIVAYSHHASVTVAGG